MNQAEVLRAWGDRSLVCLQRGRHIPRMEQCDWVNLGDLLFEASILAAGGRIGAKMEPFLRVL